MRPPILLAASLLVAGCVAAIPNPTVPVGLRPIASTDVAHWARATAPTAPFRITFTWRGRLNDDMHGGKGTLIYSPADSLQLHTQFSLGIGPNYDAAIVGDSALWAEPKEEVEKLVPSYHLLWAMIAIARPPGAGWTTESHQDAKVTSVRYTHGSDTVDYVTVHTGQQRLETRVVIGGRPLGQVWAYFDQFRNVTNTRLQLLTSPVLLELVFAKKAPQRATDRDGWTAPHDH